MKRVNRYYKSAKISEAEFRDVLRCFGEDLTASSTSRMAGVSVRSVNGIFIKIRHRLAAICEAEATLSGVVEVDESYFGPHRVKGKRGRGAGEKTIVFGILKRSDRVWTQMGARWVPRTHLHTCRRVQKANPIAGN
jgi:hypothetical protein